MGIQIRPEIRQIPRRSSKAFTNLTAVTTQIGLTSDVQNTLSAEHDL